MAQTDIYPSENIGKSVCKSIKYNQWKKACFLCTAVQPRVQRYSDSTPLIKAVVILFIFGIIVIEKCRKTLFCVIIGWNQYSQLDFNKERNIIFLLSMLFHKSGGFYNSWNFEWQKSNKYQQNQFHFAISCFRFWNFIAFTAMQFSKSLCAHQMKLILIFFTQIY